MSQNKAVTAQLIENYAFEGLILAIEKVGGFTDFDQADIGLIHSILYKAQNEGNIKKLSLDTYAPQSNQLNEHNACMLRKESIRDLYEGIYLGKKHLSSKERLYIIERLNQLIKNINQKPIIHQIDATSQSTAEIFEFPGK